MWWWLAELVVAMCQGRGRGRGLACPDLRSQDSDDRTQDADLRSRCFRDGQDVPADGDSLVAWATFLRDFFQFAVPRPG